jgi:hypothetical protein
VAQHVPRITRSIQLFFCHVATGGVVRRVAATMEV